MLAVGVPTASQIRPGRPRSVEFEIAGVRWRARRRADAAASITIPVVSPVMLAASLLPWMVMVTICEFVPP